MNIEKIAAFSNNNTGGNPAGVAILEALPSSEKMQAVAAEVGFSETVFAAPVAPVNPASSTHPQENDNWRVRYFSPESEVPFCGHATVALGAVLSEKYGTKVYHLELNHTEITVEGFYENQQYSAALQSPLTQSSKLSDDLLVNSLELFNLKPHELSTDIPPSMINAGMNHLLLALNDRQALRMMQYDLNAGRDLMNQHNIATIMLAVQESDSVFHVRNAFASGGVYEDPATGAAAAAFSGYLRDSLAYKHEAITLIQGEDMGAKSVISAEFTPEIGSSIRISGATHKLTS